MSSDPNKTYIFSNINKGVNSWLKRKLVIVTGLCLEWNLLSESIYISKRGLAFYIVCRNQFFCVALPSYSSRFHASILSLRFITPTSCGLLAVFLLHYLSKYMDLKHSVLQSENAWKFKIWKFVYLISSLGILIFPWAWFHVSSNFIFMA